MGLQKITKSIVLWTSWDQPQPRTMESDNGIFSAAVMLITEPPAAAKLPFYPIFLNLQDTKWKSLKWGIGNIEL
ncbi:hypothetical protein E2542_SST07451 [Spatholobus suberectus]|nr:hypothetical protein E2542_SST07451 [Spatholobus suberectus]